MAVSHKQRIIKNLRGKDWCSLSVATSGGQSHFDFQELRFALNELVSDEQILSRKHPLYPSVLQYKSGKLRFGR